MNTTYGFFSVLAVLTAGALLRGAPESFVGPQPFLGSGVGPSTRCTAFEERERAELELANARAAGLAELRALGTQSWTPLDAGESAELRRASAEASELGALRGGDLHLSDRDVRMILVTAGIVLLAIIIF